METTGERPDVRPHIPNAGDLCGRCASKKFVVVARRHHPSGWIINLCEHCITTKERVALSGALDDALYLSGLR